MQDGSDFFVGTKKKLVHLTKVLHDGCCIAASEEIVCHGHSRVRAFDSHFKLMSFGAESNVFSSTCQIKKQRLHFSSKHMSVMLLHYVLI